MNWTKIAEFPADLPLGNMHRYLDDHQVQHRFTEKAGLQELWLANPTQASVAIEYLDALKAGVQPKAKASPPASVTPPSHMPFAKTLTIFPLTLSIIFLGVIGYLLVNFFYYPPLIHHLTFMPIQITLTSGEVWRILTPAFLHFDILHILFNAMWIWELGRRIEVFSGKRNYLVTFLVAAIGANYLQFFLSATNNFGGLSGVVYGFLGYLWVWGRFDNNPLVKIAPGIYAFMLVWLMLGFFGFIDSFIDGQVANGAHLGGLLAGAAVAIAQVLDSKSRQKR